MNFDIQQLVDFIFSSYPKPPCSYNLNIDAPSKLPILLEILLAGARKLYGQHITPKQITEQQFDTLNDYMQSIGYTIKYNYTYAEDDENMITHINVWFVPYIKPIFNNNCGVYFMK